MNRFSAITKLLLIGCCLSISPVLLAANSNEAAIQALTSSMSEIEAGTPATGDTTLVLSAEPQVLLNALTPYLAHAKPLVRLQAISLAWKLTLKQQPVEIRAVVVKQLISALNDQDSMISQKAAQFLLTFEKADFTADNKAALLKHLQEGAVAKESILLAGIAELREQIPALQKLLIDESNYAQEVGSGRFYGSIGWAARMALARMGEQTHIDRVIALAEAEPDPVTRVTVLLRDVAYIRQPQIIPILKKFLDSNEQLPRVKDTAPGVCYCQYALDLLAQSIKDFPVKSVGPGYSDEELRVAREWMQNHSSPGIVR